MKAFSKKLIMIFIIISMLSLWILPAFAVPAVSLSLSETTFSPNGDGFRDTTIVLFNFSGSVRATVRVLRGTSVVATLHNNINLTGGPRAFVWGGTTGLTGGPGLPNGRYTMQVLVTDGSGTGSAAGDFIIARNLVGPGSIENGAITRDKIAFDAIDGSRVAPKSLGAREISLVVGNAELGDNAVTSNKIKDGEVSNADLAGGIDPTKITGGVWTSTNDGSGSGLDADTVDGTHGTALVAADAANATAIAAEATTRGAADTAEATIRATDDATEATARATGDAANTAAIAAEATTRGAADTAEATTRATDDATEATARAAGDAANTAAIAAEATTRGAADTAEAAARIAGDALAWTATNDGSGSGLDADTLDGLDSSSFVDNSAAIAAEATTRAAGDAALIAIITTETIDRFNADSADAAAWAAADTADAAAWAAADAAEATTRAAGDAALIAIITTETIDRFNADSADAAAWAAADTADATAWAAADAAEAASRAGNDALLIGIITTETIDRFNADSAEATTRATDDAAEATARTAADTAEATTRATDDAALLAALTSEATTRAAADANRLDSSALGTGVRMESGVTTVTTGLGPLLDATTSIDFGTPFGAPPVVLVSLESMTDATAKIVNLRGNAISGSAGLATIFIEANGVGTGEATIRWVAIGN